mmetsp:Transcript_53169/g.124557  ORF Transcript_53169/g.124557 Transcript_53169/m.124557 type:complete len:229 (-) Transcript_53169:1504-2190(-)
MMLQDDGSALNTARRRSTRASTSMCAVGSSKPATTGLCRTNRAKLSLAFCPALSTPSHLASTSKPFAAKLLNPTSSSTNCIPLTSTLASVYGYASAAFRDPLGTHTWVGKKKASMSFPGISSLPPALGHMPASAFSNVLLPDPQSPCRSNRKLGAGEENENGCKSAGRSSDSSDRPLFPQGAEAGSHTAMSCTESLAESSFTRMLSTSLCFRIEASKHCSLSVLARHI